MIITKAEFFNKSNYHHNYLTFNTTQKLYISQIVLEISKIIDNQLKITQTNILLLLNDVILFTLELVSVSLYQDQC